MTWIGNAANEVITEVIGCSSEPGYEERVTQQIADIVKKHCPYKAVPTSEGPLLMCVRCKNTESPAGAMARYFNHGYCMHCGGTFVVIRA